MSTTAPRSSRAMLILIVAGVLWLVMLLGGLAWWLLPRWAPGFTVRHAPLPDMVFRAAIDGDASTSAAQNRLVEMGTRATPTLINQLHHSDDKGRSLAINALAEIKDTRSTEHLIALLTDPRENLHSVAIRALAAIGDPRAIPPLVALLDDKVQDMQAASALMELPNAAVADALHPLLAQRKNPLIFLVLYDNQDPRVPGWLDGEMRYPGDVTAASKWRTRWQVSAAEALANNPQPQSAELLLAAMKDASAAVRIAAIIGASAVIKEPSPDERQAIIHLLEDPDSHVRDQAATTCNVRGIVEAVPILLLKMNDPDPLVRYCGTRGFGVNLIDPAANAKLIALAKDPSEHVRLGVVIALGVQNTRLKEQDKDPALLSALVGSLRDDSRDVRKWAIRYLRPNKPPLVIDALMRLLGDPDPIIVQESVEALSLDSWRLTDDQKESVQRASTSIRTTTP